jgi:hypothetical protein
MRLCAAVFTDSQRNPRHCESAVGRSIMTSGTTGRQGIGWCFFLLFLFAIDFHTGPQFFRGLRGSGAQQAGLAAVVATTGLLVGFVISRLLGYDPGTAPDWLPVR